MISSISFYLKACLVCIGVLLLAGCAAPGRVLPSAGLESGYRIAVFPIENLTGGKAPLGPLREKLIAGLKEAGFQVLPDERLERFMARYRLRWTGGIDAPSAEALAKEEGVQGVLITSLEFYSDLSVPKIALTSRLVTADSRPEIVWIDGVGLAGNDAPGLLELGVVREMPVLTDRALLDLVNSLVREGSGEAEAGSPDGKTFSPKAFYRSDVDPAKQFRIAVLPFYNLSVRKYAGEIMALHFLKELHKLGNIRIVEPGVVRNRLLQFRIIMEQGPSMADARDVYDFTGANLLLTGNVLNYQDEQGEQGVPAVDFTATILSKEYGTLVLAAKSYNGGDDRRHLFDFGKIRLAHGVAVEMVRGIVETLRLPTKVPVPIL